MTSSRRHSPAPLPAVTARAVRRARTPGRLGGPELDAIAVEEPLEIRVGGRTLAVTMRTPGLEREMVLGFLFAEGLIASAERVDVTLSERDNAATVRFPKSAAGPAKMLRRGTITTSACGVCGRVSVRDLLDRVGSARTGPPVPAALISRCPAILRRAQRAFRQTGGTHAAAAIDVRGRILAAAEDVGRHNAVDKVVGLLLDSRALEKPVILAVSGRASFEILQKAAAARFPCVVAVGAPSSLAVDLAERAGILLAGFVKGKRFNVYAHAERVG